MTAGPSQRPAPEPLPHPVVDGHTHLDHARRGESALPPGEALAAAAAVGVTRMVQIGCDLDSARWTASVLEEFPALVGGVALHPTEATRLSASGELDDALAEVERLAAGPRIRVIGETGLDHYWVEDAPGRAAQERSFRWHVDLAKRLGKVLQIHDRDAHDDVLRVLAEEGAPERTVFHCFSGDADMARLAADRGWYLSFAGTLTFKNAEPLREALRAVPLDLVLVETDAPYLTPSPHRGRPNVGYLVPLTVRCMAEVLGRHLEDVCATLDATSEALYGPWGLSV
ncbi:MAG TPA: TatD family hydrolase [Kineosporiaceae bacterium]|nr:TatD family hydrolase [Kineosporiaceae bacterium]